MKNKLFLTLNRFKKAAMSITLFGGSAISAYSIVEQRQVPYVVSGASDNPHYVYTHTNNNAPIAYANQQPIINNIYQTVEKPTYSSFKGYYFIGLGKNDVAFNNSDLGSEKLSFLPKAFSIIKGGYGVDKTIFNIINLKLEGSVNSMIILNGLKLKDVINNNANESSYSRGVKILQGVASISKAIDVTTELGINISPGFRLILLGMNNPDIQSSIKKNLDDKGYWGISYASNLGFCKLNIQFNMSYGASKGGNSWLGNENVTVYSNKTPDSIAILNSNTIKPLLNKDYNIQVKFIF